MEYIAMLAMLFLLVFGVGLGSGQEKGILHIVLLTDLHPDEDAKSILTDLTSEESVIRFTTTNDAFAAKQMLQKQEADAAWHIPNGLNGKVKEYVKNKTAFITVYQSHESTVLNLSREKLYRVLYPKIAFYQYMDFMTGRILSKEEEAALSEEQIRVLRSYHDKVEDDGDFLEFLTLDGGKEVEDGRKSDYLLSPMRGMLAVWLFVANAVANIYFLKDEKNGLFDFADRKKRAELGILYKISVSVNLLLLMMFALWMTGQTGNWRNEAAGGILYFLSLLLIGEIIITVFPSIYIIGSLLFPLSVWLIVSSPVFLDLRLAGMKIASLVNPVSYYLGIVADISYWKRFVIYILFVFFALLCLQVWKKAVSKT